MFPIFNTLIEIYKVEDSILFRKINNSGFLSYNRGKTYILNNKYEIGFGDSSGFGINMTQQEIADIQTFINNNEDIIRKILSFGEKYIDELE